MLQEQFECFEINVSKIIIAGDPLSGFDLGLFPSPVTHIALVLDSQVLVILVALLITGKL